MSNSDFRTIVELINVGRLEYKKMGLMTKDYEKQVHKAVDRGLKVLKDYLNKDDKQ
tara:strand:- start:538 stop:705 length:168 start_codon:yes stop_codon:yes gene_type:complete